jgi:hypothetical protein
MGAVVAPSSRHESVRDCADAIEACFTAGWTDGLPVVPPEEHVVARALDGVGWDAADVLWHEPVRGVTVHAGAVVVNAVMAGCLPEHLPVVGAALRAMAHPDFQGHPATSSTGGPGPVLIVNGPVRRDLDLNCATNVFGPGRRANAVIGRAVRLVLWNVLGARTGELDNATQGWFGKYTACIGEREESSPWAPLHVRRGFDADVSTVSVLAAESPHAVLTASGVDAEAVLFTAGDVVGGLGSHSDGQSVLVVCPEHAQILAREGWSVTSVQERLFHASRRTLAELKRAGKLTDAPQPGDDVASRPRGRVPEDIVVVHAGGDAGAVSTWIPSWSRGRGSVLVTAPVDPARGAVVGSTPGPANAPGLGDGLPR